MKTYGDLLSKLIAHYEKCIEELPEDTSERYAFLHKMEVFGGICAASEWLFKIDIHDTVFTDEFKGGCIDFTVGCIDLYLCDMPARNLTKAKELLQIRVDRMKKLFPKWENVEL